MEEETTCLECLQRRIQADFSDKLLFLYGITDSALPFSSNAVVQIDLSERADKIVSEEISTQLVLVGVASNEDGCFEKYINDYSMGNVMEDNTYVKDNIIQSEIDQCQAEVEAFNNENIASELSKQDPQCLNNYNRTSPACGRFSYLRTIVTLAPCAYVGTGSYSIIEDLSCKFLSGSFEDHVMLSLNNIVERKSTGRDGAKFLSIVGMPAFNGNNIPGCVRHPNIVPVLGMLKTPGYINILQPKTPYTLENILHYGPKALKSDWCARFLIYQILSALTYIHRLGVTHGNICPSNVMLTDSCWCWLSVCDKRKVRGNLSFTKKEEAAISPTKVSCRMENCPHQSLYVDLKLSPSLDWHSDFKRWWRGELSNYDYLLVLNRLAGRRWGDRTFHTVMPWVIDFSVRPDQNSDTGWRDLRKSKWRLAKGDEQLDFTYSTSEIPHHVSDECLSELAVCSYKARRLPLSILRSAVRSVYEPNEYPSSMQRLYQWTPDECIPEFYSDHRIFFSIHSGMSNLAVPSWASCPEEFISLHRAALESDHVSQQIHHWIDVTFGYKMSGQAAIEAKNVTLPTSDSTMLRSMGRRQLFTRPHPRRACFGPNSHYREKVSAQIDCQIKGNQSKMRSNVKAEGASDLVQPASAKLLLLETGYLEELEDAASFCEYARHLSSLYELRPDKIDEDSSPIKGTLNGHFETGTSKTPESDSFEFSDIDLSTLLEYFEADDNGLMGFQELLLWRHKSSNSGLFSEHISGDIFSVGCILAELYLKRPLFDPISISAYKESGILPGLVQELPPFVKVLVEASIHIEWNRRPSASCLLESPFFPASVRSAYLFLAPLHLLAKSRSRLQYAANLAREGALKAMGSFAAEMCAPYCLPLIMSPLSDVEAEFALYLLKEFLKCLKSQATKTLILPAIQKILQATDNYHLKVSLLQTSFVREVWNRLGKQAYLENMHPFVISNLCNSPEKNSASAASVLLIGSSEELGIPVTVHQTILPLIHCFGKGLCADGIDALVRIGALLGENFVVRHFLPLLRNVVLSCINVSHVDKPEPMQSWSALALIDSLTTLDGLVPILLREVVVKELIQDQVCLHVKVLMQPHLDLPVLQVAATTLIAVCQQIGPDFTSLHVLPQLKEFFDELAFSQEATARPGSLGRNLQLSGSKLDGEAQSESRMDLVLLLYPSFASLLGIEKLRQCCATWLLLEQFLQRCHNWKWEYTGEASRSGTETNSQRSIFSSNSEYNPAKLLLNGVGWSIPQSQGIRGGKNLVTYKQPINIQQTPISNQLVTSNLGRYEPWFWFPSPAASWDGPDFLGRIGGQKDELPWRIRATILYSVRAHPGALRTFAVCHDEYTVFTGGVGPGFKGTVQKWELPRVDCISGYYGHEEVVHSISILSASGRIASCDGTIHVWNSQTGKLISAYTEPSSNSSHLTSSLPTPSKMNSDQAHMHNHSTLSSGVLSTAFNGNLYTCMHHLESDDKLVAGMGNGSLRFIDVAKDQKLHLWKSEAGEYSLSSLVSAICSCGSEKLQAESGASSSSWIAAGLSSGHCRLLDARSGSIIALWKAHDGYITKLEAPKDHLLVSSSLDRTLRIWDLRRNWPAQLNSYRVHSDGISSFSVWGQDVISVSKNKIGLSSLSKPANQRDGQHWLSPQNLYSADRGSRNLSVLSSISILPFSRLFLVGTEDGYLKICC